MQCDHQLVSEKLFDYIDQKLSASDTKAVAQAIQSCRQCEQVFQQAYNLNKGANQWQEQPVPEWHRTEYAVRPRASQKGWLNWMALATSTLAILMVVFQVQISSTDNGLQIAFGSQNAAQVEALVEKRMAAYKKQQSTLLEARLLAAEEKQATNSKLIVADLLEKTRDERRDDLNFLITGIQTQRFEDQNKVEKRLSYLAENQIENNQYINQLIQSDKISKGENQ